METLRVVALALATVSVGLIAGVFFGWAVSVMPGLARTDDRTFVAAFQAMDRAIVRPPFVSVFTGALLLTAAAGLLHLGAEHRAALLWTAAAFVLYLLSFVFTVRVNIPLNDALKAAGDPDRIDVAAARERFDEARWGRWHNIRTVLCTVALACLIVALTL
ncbi:anthrone oxygenase family protein [Glycomyces arizonensis]|uniref:anthrone oxygenase family protein n=1 Tax=Glycomyces arizonensis TaxID=256035 RepID=UPI00047ED77A|nr:anthrone oxygenase family protein [Glycomyces arizonensis]